MYLGLTILGLVSFTALLPSVVDASVNWNSSNVNSSSVACSDFDPTGIVFIICHNVGPVSNPIVLVSANGNEDADFWEGLRRLAQQTIDVSDYVATLYPAKINSFKQSMDHVVSNTGKLRSKIESKARARGMTLHEVSEMLSKELEGVFKELKDEFPPPDEAEHHDDRDKIISGALKKVEDAVVQSFWSGWCLRSRCVEHTSEVSPPTLNMPSLLSVNKISTFLSISAHIMSDHQVTWPSSIQTSLTR